MQQQKRTNPWKSKKVSNDLEVQKISKQALREGAQKQEIGFRKITIVGSSLAENRKLRRFLSAGTYYCTYWSAVPLCCCSSHARAFLSHVDCYYLLLTVRRATRTRKSSHISGQSYVCIICSTCSLQQSRVPISLRGNQLPVDLHSLRPQLGLV